MVLIMYETYQFHFELLNIGYAAYLTFFGFCKQAFPDISDQTISRMVGGLHVDLYRPDDELKRLAKEAVRLGIGDEIRASTDAASLFASLRDNGGGEWVADWERTADPWFLVATDPGHPGGYSHYGTWASEPDIPLASVHGVHRRAPGRRDDRPSDRGGSRRARPDRGRVPRSAGRRGPRRLRRRCCSSPGSCSSTSRSTCSTSSTGCGRRSGRKSHELSRALAEMGEFDDPGDMFFLRRTEVMEAIYDIVAAWSVGRPAARRRLLAADHRASAGGSTTRSRRGRRRPRSASRRPRSTSRSR